MRQTYVLRDGKLVPKETAAPLSAPNFHVMPDLAPFKSPLDFKTEISSRSQLRDYERRHGVRQVGTDFNSTYARMKESAGLE